MKKISVLTIILSALILNGCTNFDDSLDTAPTDTSPASSTSAEFTTAPELPGQEYSIITSTAISFTFSHVDMPFVTTVDDDLDLNDITADDDPEPLDVDDDPDTTTVTGADKTSPEESDDDHAVTTSVTTTSAANVTTTTTPSTSVSFSSVSKKVYASGYAVFYVSATESSSVLRYIDPGSEMTVTAQSSDGNWYNVVFNGMKGYVKTSQTSNNKPASAKTTTTTQKPATTTTTKTAAKTSTAPNTTTTKSTTTTTKNTTTTAKKTTTAGTIMPLDPHFEAQRIAAENEIVKLTNELRSSLGVGELTVDSRLSHAAMIRAQEITTNFAHLRPDGRKSLTVFDEVGCGDFLSKGENIASAYGFMQTGSGFFNQWKNSKGHYDNMTNAKYNTIGVAVFYVAKDGVKYCYSVQLFGRK